MRSLVLLLACTACGRIGFDQPLDASADAQLPGPAARVVSKAYWTNYFGTTIGTPGTSFTGYSLPTAGVVDGELLVIFACIDNGTDTVWPTPLGPGFTELYQKRWGNDGQTCAINWKIAANEPPEYTGTYGPGIVSGSSLLTLVALRDASGIGLATISAGTGSGTNPVPQTSSGVVTGVPDTLVLYASASDWECFETTDVTFTTPAGFSPLFLSTDRGDTKTKDWTAFQIATRRMPTPGSTGPISSVETSTGGSTCLAVPWTATLSITPR